MEQILSFTQSPHGKTGDVKTGTRILRSTTRVSFMLKRIFQIVAFTTAAFTVAVPQATVQAQAPFQGEGGKVRVLSFPSGNDYPFWAVTKLGLDKKYGFELEHVRTQPGGAVATAFRSGAVDGGSMN